MTGMSHQCLAFRFLFCFVLFFYYFHIYFSFKILPFIHSVGIYLASTVRLSWCFFLSSWSNRKTHKKTKCRERLCNRKCYGIIHLQEWPEKVSQERYCLSWISRNEEELTRWSGEEGIPEKENTLYLPCIKTPFTRSWKNKRECPAHEHEIGQCDKSTEDMEKDGLENQIS
jgi:hypothetical protein